MPRPPALNPDGTRKNPPRARDIAKAEARAAATLSLPGILEPGKPANAAPIPAPVASVKQVKPASPVVEVMSSEEMRAWERPGKTSPLPGFTPDAEILMRAPSRRRTAAITECASRAAATVSLARSVRALWKEAPEAAIRQVAERLPITNGGDLSALERELPWSMRPIILSLNAELISLPSE